MAAGGWAGELIETPRNSEEVSVYIRDGDMEDSGSRGNFSLPPAKHRVYRDGFGTVQQAGAVAINEARMGPMLETQARPRCSPCRTPHTCMCAGSSWRKTG